MNSEKTVAEVHFWSSDRDCEMLQHEDLGEVIYERVGELEPGELKPGAMCTIYAFCKIPDDSKMLSAKLENYVMENTLEHLDDFLELGHREEATEPTAAMWTAAHAFVKAMLAEYDIRRCEHAPSENLEVDLYKWVQENEPELLEVGDV